MTDIDPPVTVCPECASRDIKPHVRKVSSLAIGMLFVTFQTGYRCCTCGERWSTARQCEEADARLCAQGWKPRCV